MCSTNGRALYTSNALEAEVSMVQVLPVACDGTLTGSAIVVGWEDQTLYLATALHILGSAQEIQVALPPHGGDCSQQQRYPITGTQALYAEVGAVDPIADLAILKTSGELDGVQIPKLVGQPNQLPVGSEVVVLGYPFAPLGSFLETWVPGVVTAVTRRVVTEGVEIDELVLSNIAHPGSSGSAVLGRQDSLLYGVLRGSLSPPEVIKIGNVPIATDTSVTFATSAHFLNSLLDQTRNVGATDG